MSRPNPSFSRSGVSSPLGKLTEQIPAIRVSGETKDILERDASRAGMALNEFVRELLDIRAHGLEAVHRMHDARLQVVSGTSPVRVIKGMDTGTTVSRNVPTSAKAICSSPNIDEIYEGQRRLWMACNPGASKARRDEAFAAIAAELEIEVEAA